MPRWRDEDQVRGGRAGGGPSRGGRSGKGKGRPKDGDERAGVPPDGEGGRDAREREGGRDATREAGETEAERADGVVTRLGARSTRVWIEARGEERRCAISNLLWDRESDETRPVAVGDRVVVRLSETGDGTIVEVAPRVSQLVRRRVAGKDQPGKPGQKVLAQVVASNIDRLVIVAALADPPFRAGLVDRYVVAARAEGIEPLVVLNKVDLAGDRDVVAPYRACGLTVLETSTATGEGIDALADLMRDGISLLVGHSGVGKSTLLNTVSPGLKLEIGDVTDYHGRGRHTTTSTTLLRLARGGWVVDSPGIREFGLHGVQAAQAARLFPGLEALAERCHYGDCRHRDEPGCAVLDALAAGTLAPERHESYLRLLETLEQDG